MMRGLAVGAAAVLSVGLACAQDRIEPVPKALQRVGIVEKLDAALPLALTFTDDRGRDVTLGSYFRPGRPVVLTLNYYRCPMLCTLELNGLVDAMKGLGWAPGDEYEVVTVSFDPREKTALARAKKLSYLESLGRPQAEAGWHFLTGTAGSVDALSQAVGFAAEYDKDTDQYGHAAVIMVVTPEGRLSRYLYGVRFAPETLKLALVEASKGAIGSSWERFLLYCYHYDPDRGSYSLAALAFVRAGGVLTMLALASVIGAFWIRERKGRRR
jgi:protein SCO1/2